MLKMAKLKWEMVSCSSSDDSDDLEWQSAKFCEFPQTVLLRLPHRSQISQMEILSHQHKIATRIEIHISTDLNDCQFQRLGYFSLNDNCKTNYRARELKSVIINKQATFVKLTIENCHKNTINLFNQAGFIDLHFFGDDCHAQKEIIRPIKHYQNTIFHDDHYLKFFFVNHPLSGEKISLFQVLEALRILKNSQIKLQSYDEATLLKQLEGNVQTLGMELRKLEKEKFDANEDENYELAKEILNSMNESLRKLQDITDQVVTIDGDKNGKFYGSDSNPSQSIQSGESLDETVHTDPETFLNESVDISKNISCKIALSGIEGCDGLYFSKFATSEKLQVYTDFVIVFGEDIIHCHVNPNWKVRAAALKKIALELQNDIPQSKITKQFISSLFLVILDSLQDKHLQVFLTGVKLLHETIIFSDDFDFKEEILPILAILVKSLGNSDERKRKASSLSFILLADSTNIPAEFILKYLSQVSQSNYLNVNTRVSYEKLKIIRCLIADHQCCKGSETLVQRVMDFMKLGNLFTNPNEKVRNAAREVVVTLQMEVGDKLTKYLDDLRPVQIEEYKRAFIIHDSLSIH